MGVNLSPITEATEIELSDLRGKSVAIDAYNTIFQFLSIIRQPDGKPLQDSQGRVTSHLSGILYRTANLIEAGIEPSFVFDGKPNEMKAGTIEERIARREKAMVEYQQALEEGDLKKAFSKAQQTSRMTPDILETSKELLTLLGVADDLHGERQHLEIEVVGLVYGRHERFFRGDHVVGSRLDVGEQRLDDLDAE